MAAEERKTISAMFEEIKEEMCDKYCKYPSQTHSDEALYRRCNECPLNRL